MSTSEQKNSAEHMASLTPHEENSEVEEIIDGIENLPKDAKKLVKKLVVQEFGMMGIGHLSPENEITKKINEEHITNYLDGAKEQMKSDYKERHEKKIYTVILVVLALAFFIAVIVLLKDEKTDILEKIIYSASSLVAGAFGGYGLGKHSNHSND